jgi:hypothetical protein
VIAYERVRVGDVLRFRRGSNQYEGEVLVRYPTVRGFRSSVPA